MRVLALLLTVLFVGGCTPRVIAAPTVTPLVMQATATATAKPTSTPPPTATATLTPTASPNQVMVVRVIDGDTIEIEGGERVRYLGIDAPEPNKCYGPEATAKNRELVERKKVTLEKDVSERDAFGRLLRYVHVNGLFVNAELVRLGYALAYHRSPDIKYQELLSQLELVARQTRLGLWGPACATPMPITGQIAITYIFYDGVVPRVESDEYVELCDQSAGIVDMTGWKLVSVAGGQTYIFSLGFTMRPGQTCRVYTNEYHPESCGLSFGSGSAIWRNSGDTAVLMDSQGKEVARYGY